MEGLDGEYTELTVLVLAQQENDSLLFCYSIFMDDIPQIYLFKYLAQLNGHKEMADRIGLIANAQDGQFLDSVANEGVRQMDTWLGGVQPSVRDKISKGLFDREREKAQLYPAVIANQTLVLMCATIDMYLQDAMRTILDTDKNAISALCDTSDISVHDVINNADTDTALHQIKNRISERFDFKGIDKKFNDLEKCGIKMDSLFNQKEINKKTMLEAYETRHNIVHKGAQPFKSSEDLQEYYANFIRFLSSFANRCKKDKNILDDLDVLVKAE